MKLFVSILIPLVVGAISGLLTSSGVRGWYATINKPPFNLPNGLFAPVWTLLYVLMGIALFLVWRSQADKALKKKAISFFAIQLFLNFCWSIIFFTAHEPGWALAEISIMWLMIAMTISSFARISSAAAWLMAPYICWVSFAFVLNYAIWKLN